MRKYVQNKKSNTGCRQVLGEEKEVRKFHDFYKENEENIRLVAIAHNISYCQDQIFTKEEYKAFQIGLAAMEFFKSCYDEVEFEEHRRMEEHKRLNGLSESTETQVDSDESFDSI